MFSFMKPLIFRLQPGSVQRLKPQQRSARIALQNNEMKPKTNRGCVMNLQHRFFKFPTPSSTSTTHTSSTPRRPWLTSGPSGPRRTTKTGSTPSSGTSTTPTRYTIVFAAPSIDNSRECSMPNALRLGYGTLPATRLEADLVSSP